MIEQTIHRDQIIENTPSPSWPKVSVISVSYNSVKCADKTIQSVLQLDYPNLEYLIIDNRSEDGTLELLNKYPAGLFKLISEKDEGPYDAMNKGIKLASGEWIWFMNMGDYFPNNPLLLREIFERKIPEVQSVLYGDAEVFRKDFRYTMKYATEPGRNLKFGILTLNHQAMVCRKSLFDEMGGFDHKRFKIKADAHWLTKVMLKYGPGTFVHCDQIFANYNEEGLSSNSQNFGVMFREDALIVSETGNIYQHGLLYINHIFLMLRVWVLENMLKNKSVYAAYRRIKYFNHYPKTNK